MSFLDERMAALAKMSMDEQVDKFLHAFLWDLCDSFDRVYEYVNSFKQQLATALLESPNSAVMKAGSLDTMHAKLFFRKHGDEATEPQLRTFLKTINLEQKKGPVTLPIIVYLLFKFDKTSSELCTPEEFGELHPSILAVHAAVDNYQALMAKQLNREVEMEQLRIEAEAGGLKGGRARVKLHTLENQDQNIVGKQEGELKRTLRDAQKYLEKNDPMLLAKKNLEEQEKRKKADERERRASAKAKIVAMAEKFGSTGLESSEVTEVTAQGLVMSSP